MNQTRLIGPHSHDYENVANCLASFRDETVVFVPNPGNAGDNLINLGAYRLFESLGIRYILGAHAKLYPDRVIIHSGGGSMVSHFPGSDTFFRRNHPVCKAMILLPHTIRTYADMISDMDERCHLFARETPSYEFVAQHINRAHLYKAHDMAFMLDKTYIQNLHWDFADIYHKGLLRSWVTMIAKFTAIAKLRDSTLHSFRTDNETDSLPTHPLNFDMSRMFATADMHMVSCKNTAKALSTVLKAFSHVKTDRLHIAILSAILGLDVDMNDNNYGKNHDIYIHSMRNKFENVTFGDMGKSW